MGRCLRTGCKPTNIKKTTKNNYDNGLGELGIKTGCSVIDDIPFAVGKVVWIIMASNYDLHDYEESATEYGVTKDGKWAALSDGHCSCYGWEAVEDCITYYDNLDELLKADEEAGVILAHKDKLLEIYPFLKWHIERDRIPHKVNQCES